MRIRSLTFAAVGPYPGRHHIDFDQLGGTGLYLINGPTGAGKTTIIDCIVYALYGKPSGDESDPSRMRSDFAAPTDPTEVDLVFETAHGVHRVIRKPAYMRAAKRGEGLTESKAECKVFRVHPDGTETVVASQIAAANDELSRVVGLSREQFVQTVVLPQGQFATFLRADTRQREDVLKRIFNTRLYEKVVELLKEDARAVGQQKAEATRAIREQLRRESGLIGIDEEALQVMLGHVDNGFDDLLLEALDALLPALDEDLHAATAVAASTQASAEAADAARDLAKQERDAVAAVTRTEEARSAAQLRVEAARTAVEGHPATATSVGLTLDADEDEAVWRQRADLVNVEIGGLRGLIETEQRVLAWPREREAMEERLAKLLSAQEQAQAAAKGIPAELTAQESLIAVRPTADEGTDLAERRQQVRNAQRALDALSAAAAAIPPLEETAKQARARAEAVAGQLQAATTALRAGWAAQMAQELIPGEPCRVCGATEHPHPAQPGADHVSTEQVEELAAAVAAAGRALARSEEQLEQARVRVETAQAAVTLSAEQLATLEQETSAAEAALQQRTRSAEAAEAELLRLRAEQARLEKAIAAADVDLVALRTELATREEAHVLDASAVEQARGAFASIATRIEALSALRDALNALAGALTGLQAAATAADEAAAVRAALPERDGFADLALAEAAWQAADQARADAEQERRLAEGRRSALVKGRATLDRLCQERRQLIADSADLLDLAELFAPGRGADSGLHIYVLKALFDNVVEAANRRFETLLGGRFRLAPSGDAEGDGRRLQGLGLSVHDGLTGKSRPAKSLSGGETFCASLALALGLADVVRMTAGGVEIASLFIDEGFGSLDPKPLEDVMQMLRQLGSNGRLVGVISHVPDMKQAIPERIEVRQVEEGKPTSLEVSWMA